MKSQSACRSSKYWLVAAIVLVAPPAVLARTTVLQDFDEANFDGFGPALDFTAGQPYGPTQYGLVEDGPGDHSYNIRSSAAAPSLSNDGFAFICTTWQASTTDSAFSNGFARATLRAETEGTVLGFLMRDNPDRLTSYQFWRNTETGTFSIISFGPQFQPQRQVHATTADNSHPFAPGDGSWKLVRSATS